MKRPNRCKRTRQALREAERELKWAKQAYSRNPGSGNEREIEYARQEFRRAFEDHGECRARARKGK